MGHYELRRCLGSGGFGQVFEAWDAKLCRKVAVKRLKTVASPVGRGRLVEEARLAASLQHPAFVRIFALEEEEDTQSIVMELVPGQTLRDFAAQEALTPPRIFDIIGQLACAMAEVLPERVTDEVALVPAWPFTGVGDLKGVIGGFRSSLGCWSELTARHRCASPGTG
jgi:serine/threonine protein kinase